MDEPPSSPLSNMNGGFLPASVVNSNTAATPPQGTTTNHSGSNSSLHSSSTTPRSSTNGNSHGSTGTLSLHSSDYYDDDDDEEEDDFLFLDLAAYADHSHTGTTQATTTKTEEEEDGPFLALPSFSEQMNLERRREQEEAAAATTRNDHKRNANRSTRTDSSDTTETVESHDGSHHHQQQQQQDHDNEVSCQQQEQPQNNNTKKSALKSSSSYGNIHDAHNNDIPVCTKKSSWKKLPVPKLAGLHRTQRNNNTIGAFGSSPSLLQTTAASQDTSHSSHNNNTNTAMKNRTVSFSNIHVRDYEITVGDNPGGMQGTPVSLGWQYQQHAAIGVAEYEQHRPQRRSRQELYLPSGARQDMLLNGSNGGLSRSEVVAAEAAADKIRKQRARTKAWIPLQKLEDLVESATRKAKRMGRIVAHPSTGGKHHHHHHNSTVLKKNPAMPYSSSTGCLKSYHHHHHN